MNKKKQVPASNLNPTWVVTDHFQWNGRHMTVGTELSIQGHRGRFRFIQYVQTPKSEWVDVVGGKNNTMRSFHPDKIKTVHRLTKMRQKK